jgi:gliding motility-associated-like protein
MNLLQKLSLFIIVFFQVHFIFAQPSNDECSNPTVIIPYQTCSGTLGDLTGSNKSSLNPTNSFFDVWYFFTATTSIHYLTVISSGDFKASFQIYTGNCGALTSIANFAGTTPGTTATLSGLNVGQTYIYRVYHNGSTLPTTKEFETCVENYILNNDCLGAIEITPSSPGEPCGGLRGRTSGATQTMPGCNGSAEDDVWYKFKANSSTHFVEVDGDANFNTVLQIFKGDCNNLSSLQCINNTTAGGIESIKLTNLTVGDWYYARVYDNGTTGSTTPYFNICVTTPPVNDDCLNAVEVKFGNSCTSEFTDGTYATQSLVAGSNMGDASDDVWFKFTPDTSVAFISIQPSMDYDPVVQLFSACGTPTSGISTFYDDNSYAQGVFGTAIVKGLIKGNTYYYRIYDKSNVIKDMMSFTTCVVKPAANDDCEKATKITPGLTCIETTGDGTYTTQSTPSTGGKGDANDDVWYQFTATSSSHNITVNASLKYNPIVQLFNGCMTPTTGLSSLYEDALFPIGGSYTAKINGLTIGNTYYYRVYDKESINPQTMTFTTCVTTAPPNDDCNNAKMLYVNNTCEEIIGDGKYATQSVENACSGSATSNDDDIWYKFTATSNNAFISVTPDDSQYDPIVQVFSGCGTPLTPTFCEDNLYSKGKFGTAMVSNLVKGNTYYYRIYDKASTKQDTMTIKTCVVSSVENDNCNNAINVTPGLTCNEIISDATYSTESFAKASCGSVANDDVWFKFTANNDSLFISVTPKDKTYDPVVEVFNNCPTSATPNLLCDDNSFPIGKFGTKIITGLTPGNTYYYRVYDKDGVNEDTMEISTCIVNPVINNDCINATTIISSTNCEEVSGDGTYASQSFSPCSGSAGAANDDVWYKFTATSTKENISVYASKFYDPVIEVYTSCNTPINPAICNDINFPVNGFGTISLNTIPNTTYYYRVYDKNTTNNYPLTFSTCVTHAPINDDCNGAIKITSGSTCNEINAEGTYATKSVGTTANCLGDDADDVWFKFTATNTNQTIYVNANQNYNPIVQLYSNCSNSPTPFPSSVNSCNDIRYPTGGVGSNTFTGLTVGNEYFYRVYDTGNTIKTPLKFSTCVTNPPDAPINDNPCKATLITPKLSCDFQTFTNEAATATSGISIPKCGTLAPNDVWFKTVVPFSGSLTIDTKELTVVDGTIAVYKGTCNSLLELNCDINTGTGEMPKLALTNLSPGDTIWIRFWSDKTSATGSFGICVTKPIEAPLVDGCSNLSFQNGTVSWFGTTGDVYKVAGMTNVPNPFYRSTVSNIGTGPFFTVVTSGVDPVCGFPLVPAGYSSSLRLGDGKTTGKRGSTIEQYFKVDKSNANFIYNYAVVFNAERSGTNKHEPYQQPFFKAEVFDDEGNPISCGDYLVGAFSEPGFLISPTSSLVTYKPWTKVSIDLSAYIGKAVHVRYTTGDCTEGGHYGYAYIACNCAPFEISKPSKVCIGDTAKLYGPKGAQTYSWKDPSGAVISTKDSVYIKTTTAGKFKYTLDVTMFGTSMCQNTLEAEIEVGASPTLKITNPDTVCIPNTVDITTSDITDGSSSNLVYSYWTDASATIPLSNKSSINTSGTYYIKGVKSPTCLDIQPVNVTINPLPKVADKTAIICSGEQFTVSPTNTLPDEIPTGTKYKWTVVDNTNVSGESNQTTGQTEISQTLTNNSNTSQDVVYTVTPFTPDCDGTPFTLTVIVNPIPKISDKTIAICSNNSFDVSPANTSPDIVPSSTTFTWNYTDNSNITNEANSTTDETSVKSSTNLINTTSSVQTVDYTVTPKSGTCIGSTFKVTVSVNPAPKVTDFAKNICTGTAFDATPTDNGTTKLVPIGTTYTWSAPTISGGITGSSAQTNVSAITQTLTNPDAINHTATYVITANSNTTPNCSSTFNAVITVEPKVQPIITCGTSNATSMEFTWVDIPSVTSYNFEYKVGSSGTLSATASIPAGSTSKTILGLTAGNSVYFTLTPVGILCPLPATKMCANCAQPSVVNNNVATPSDFEICVGESITLKASESPTNNSQWGLGTAGIVTNTIQSSKNLMDVTGTTAGTTDINFTNDAGCATSITLKVNPKPIIADITKTICSGTLFDTIPNGSLNTIPTGTTYTWTVTPPSGITGAISQNTAQTNISQTLTNTTNTPVNVVYTVTATNGTSPNQCSSTFNITVTVNPKPQIVDMNETICSGTAFTLSPVVGTSGNIVPSTTTYTWSQTSVTGITGNNNQAIGQNTISETLTNNSASNLSIVYDIVANSLSCTNTFKGNITVLATPKIEDKTDVICSELPFTISPTTQGNDIVPSGTTFTWTVLPVTGLAGISNQTSAQNNISQTITNTTSGQLIANYIITASVGTTPTCTSTFKADISVNPKPLINQQTQSICSENLFSISPTDGNGNTVPTSTQYTWVSPSVINITGNSDELTNQTTIYQTLTNSTSSKIDVNYTVTASSTFSNVTCTNTFPIVISVQPKPSISVNPVDICTGNSFTFSPTDGGGNIVPTGTTYTWTVIQEPTISGGSDVNSPQNSISQVLSTTDINTRKATYTILGTTNTTPSCSNTFTGIVNINPQPSISTKNISICSGTAFTCSPTTTNGDIVPSGTKYTWNVSNVTGITGNSDESNGQSNVSQTLTNNSNTPITAIYIVTATVGIAPNTCSSTFTLNVTVNPTPKIADKTATICSGETFSIQPTDNSPTEIVPTNTLYNWTVSNTAGTNGASSVSVDINTISQSITHTQTNPVVLNYIVTANSGVAPTICSSNFTALITVNPLPTFSPTATSQCEKDPLYIQANATNVQSVAWSGPNGFTASSNTDDKITVVSAASATDNGLYSVEVIDKNNCKNSKSVTVSINLLPNVFAGNDTNICIGQSAILKASGASSYVWDNNIQNNQYFTPSLTNTYTVTGTDSKGCKNTDDVIVSVNPLPDFNLSVNEPCEQSNLVFSVDLTNNPSTAGIYSSSWNGPNGFASTVLNPFISNVTSAATGLYNFELIDNNKCSKFKSINALINLVDNIQFADLNPKCINDDPFLLPVPNIIGGTWSSDDNSSIQNPYSGLFDPKKSKPDQEYKVVVTYSTKSIIPARKCPSTLSKVLFVNPIPDSTFYAKNPVICIDDTLHLVINQPNKNVNYTWDLGNGNIIKLNNQQLDYIYPKDGDFTIKLLAELGNCKVSQTKQAYVHVIPKPTLVDFTQSETEIDFYNPEIQFKSYTNGKYLLWSFGDGTYSNFKNPTHKFPENPGEYIIDLTASNMENNVCSKSVTRSIFMPEPVIYFIPNTFTPNGDELNNVFQPIFTFGYDPQNYGFYIYNRWGELLFETHDTKIGWDGTYGNQIVQNDSYIWKLEFKEKLKEDKHNKTGHVNVLR